MKKRLAYALALVAALALYAAVVIALYAQLHPEPTPVAPLECRTVGATSPTDKFVIQYPTAFVRFCAPVQDPARTG